MSNRHFQLALNTLAPGRRTDVLVGKLLNIIVISIIIVVAILRSPLADWTT